MRAIYLDILTTSKDEQRLSFDTIYQRTGISVSKLQRIFTGQQSMSVDDFELICEKGLNLDLDDVYARFGRQEFRDSEDVDYKGAKELLADFNQQKDALREQYEERVTREQEAVDFLKGILSDFKGYNAELTERAVKAEEEFRLAQKTSHWAVGVGSALVALFATLLIVGIMLNLPHLGMGNCDYLH